MIPFHRDTIDLSNNYDKIRRSYKSLDTKSLGMSSDVSKISTLKTGRRAWRDTADFRCQSSVNVETRHRKSGACCSILRSNYERLLNRI